MIISRSALLPYSALQIYDVVADIEAYPDFLNWCQNANIIRESEDGVVAKLGIRYAKLKFDFTTRNVNISAKSIKLNLVDGPFSSFEGEWLFIELEEKACKVSLNMQFDFKRSLTKRIMEKMFGSIIDMQLDAFMRRAEQLYGHK